MIHTTHNVLTRP